MACCKIHKETCQATTTSTVSADNLSTDSLLTPAAASSSSSASLNDKLKASSRLSTFLSTNPYLFEQLPVLLARIDRRAPTSSDNHSNELARELERKQRIVEVLKETLEVDPKIAELFTILQDENLI